MSPLEAALKGAGEIGFTIISISVSLVAVFIPLLLMGGIIGRLFREFAITVTMTIAVSAFVSLTLSPMMCALFLRDEKHAQPWPRRTWRWSAASSGCWRAYTRGLDFVLAHQRATLMRLPAAPWRSPVCCTSIMPKGFFPQQDTGIIIGVVRCAAGHLLRRDGAPAARAARRRGRQGSGRRELWHRHRRQPPDQQRLRDHRPQAARPSARPAPTRSSTACGRSSRRSRAQRCSCRRRRTSTSAAAPAHPVSVHAAGFGYRRAEHVGADGCSPNCRSCRCCATSPPISRPASGMLSLTIDRDQAARFGIQPAADRSSAL